MPSSFINGNNFWFLPSRYCDGINEPMGISLSEDIPKQMRSDLLNSTSPIKVQQRMVYANFSSQMQVDVNFHVKVSLFSFVPHVITFLAVSNKVKLLLLNFQNQSISTRVLLVIVCDVFLYMTQYAFDFLYNFYYCC